MAIDLYEGIMHHLNVLNVLNVSNKDGKWNLKVKILVSYAWKSSFWHHIRQYSYTDEVKWYL